MKPAWLFIAVLLVLGKRGDASLTKGTVEKTGRPLIEGSVPSFPQEDEDAPKGPSVVKLPVDEVVAQLTFENRVKISVSSKPTPLKPGTYWLKTLSLFKQDDKKRTWELRSTGSFGSLANVTIDAGQEKVLLLGRPVTVRVEAKPSKDLTGLVVITAALIGASSERYVPGAYLEGKTMTSPTFTIKAPDGKVLKTGAFTMTKENYGRFDWRPAFGFKGAYTVEVQPAMGPFEYKVSTLVEPVP